MLQPHTICFKPVCIATNSVSAPNIYLPVQSVTVPASTRLYSIRFWCPILLFSIADIVPL